MCGWPANTMFLVGEGGVKESASILCLLNTNVNMTRNFLKCRLQLSESRAGPQIPPLEWAPGEDGWQVCEPHFE